MTLERDMQSEFVGKKVLLVEDNFLVGLSMKSMLSDLGCEVTGPIATVAQARALAQKQEFNAAVLDVNIIGGTSAEVAMALGEKGCPYIFVTGFASKGVLPEVLADVPRFRKPVDEQSLRQALVRAFG